MPQRFSKIEKIGILTNLGTSAQLTSSKLTIGGQQYSTGTLTVNYGTLTANTLYMIYATVTVGVVSLVISTNVNSIGPATYNSWKLVGAFYSNGLSSVGFGSFVNIEGAPSCLNAVDTLPTVTTSTGTMTNFTPTMKWRRNGSTYSGDYRIVFTGVVGTWTNASISIPFTVDGAQSAADTNLARFNLSAVDTGSIVYSGWSRLGVNTIAFYSSSISTHTGDVPVRQNSPVFSNVFPFAFGNTDTIMGEYQNIPVLAWSTIPLKDL